MDKWAETMRIGRNLRLRSSQSVTTGETTERRLTYDIDDVSALELDLVPEHSRSVQASTSSQRRMARDRHD